MVKKIKLIKKTKKGDVEINVLQNDVKFLLKDKRFSLSEGSTAPSEDESFESEENDTSEDKPKKRSKKK